MPPAPRVIGIDLGTTNSCVSIRTAKGIHVLEIDGQRTVPSIVAFTDKDYLVGKPARAQMFLNPSNTVYDAKRLVGRKFSEQDVQDDLANMNWPFTVRRGSGDKPTIRVKYKNTDRDLRPEQISALVLEKLKQAAEKTFGASIEGAVITVPAYFTDSQRQATKTAGIVAGLKVLSVINEPTAAALAYVEQEFGHDNTGRRNVLVFDLGGGTFDVSVVTIEADVVEVRAAAGDDHLGGEDFTSRMADHFVEQIRQAYNVDLRRCDDPRAMLRLQASCEAAKIQLSKTLEASFSIDYLWPGQPSWEGRITRQQFELINEDFFRQCLRQTAKSLKDAHLDVDSVDDIVLVGGSTRIPKVKALLSDMFGARKICDSVNPDEVVSYGAAVQASILTGASEKLLVDVTNFSLGTNTKGDVMSVIIKRNQPLAAKGEREYTTIADNQTQVRIDIYEGESKQATENKLLDTFTLSGIPPLVAGEPRILVRFKVDFDGTLSASAHDRTPGGGNSTKATLKVTRQNQAEDAQNRVAMVSEHVGFKSNQEDRLRVAKARKDLFKYASDRKHKALLRQVPENVNARQLASDCDRELTWLMQSGDSAHESELTYRLSQLMKKAEPDRYGGL